MHDDKRLLRQLKKQVKKQGNRKRRRFLKNIHSDPDAFEFGVDGSESMNAPEHRRRDSSRED